MIPAQVSECESRLDSMAPTLHPGLSGPLDRCGHQDFCRVGSRPREACPGFDAEHTPTGHVGCFGRRQHGDVLVGIVEFLFVCDEAFGLLWADRPVQRLDV